MSYEPACFIQKATTAYMNSHRVFIKLTCEQQDGIKVLAQHEMYIIDTELKFVCYKHA